MGQVSAEFYSTVLTAIGAPVSETNFHGCRAWQTVEGGTAENNPWNTTQPAPDATDYNSVGVKNYPTWQEGAHATVVTLHNGYYPEIINAFRAQDLQALGRAVDSSPWGTHGLEQYLSENPGPEPSQPGDPTEDETVTKLPTLGEGAGLHAPDGNPHVKIVQASLNTHGLNLSVDGKFGPDTANNVRAFQQHSGIKDDGVVGPETYGKLFYIS